MSQSPQGDKQLWICRSALNCFSEGFAITRDLI
jgi:hypothetical protein